MDSRKNTPMKVLRFRTYVTSNLYRRFTKHYGHVKVIAFEDSFLKNIDKSQEVCIIQDKSNENFIDFKKEFLSTKANAYRTVINNGKTVKYIIENEGDPVVENYKIFRSDLFISFLIYTFRIFRKLKKVLIFEKKK